MILISESRCSYKNGWIWQQNDREVYPEPLMVSLSNHERLGAASLEKLRTSRLRRKNRLCNRPEEYCPSFLCRRLPAYNGRQHT